jgi:hypothetical protein
MSEAELRSYSQRQLLSMCIEQRILPTLQKVWPWVTGDTPLEFDEGEIVRMPPERLLHLMVEHVPRRV